MAEAQTFDWQSEREQLLDFNKIDEAAVVARRLAETLRYLVDAAKDNKENIMTPPEGQVFSIKLFPELGGRKIGEYLRPNHDNDPNLVNARELEPGEIEYYRAEAILAWGGNLAIAVAPGAEEGITINLILDGPIGVESASDPLT